MLGPLADEYYTSDDKPMLLTNVDHIGTYVARIVADPRTVNKAVIIWEDEVLQKDAHEIGARVSGDGDALRAQQIQVRASPDYRIYSWCRDMQ